MFARTVKLVQRKNSGAVAAHLDPINYSLKKKNTFSPNPLVPIHVPGIIFFIIPLRMYGCVFFLCAFSHPERTLSSFIRSTSWLYIRRFIIPGTLAESARRQSFGRPSSPLRAPRNVFGLVPNLVFFPSSSPLPQHPGDTLRDDFQILRN